ncbi:hypothetical protein [Streptomyces wuyuanensis]|uniref:hypothetical protein n=1 Tax=Streptomyces wuyuanensis TaxID=1196353 RepID=UPI003444DBEF
MEMSIPLVQHYEPSTFTDYLVLCSGIESLADAPESRRKFYDYCASIVAEAPEDEEAFYGGTVDNDSALINVLLQETSYQNARGAFEQYREQYQERLRLALVLQISNEQIPIPEDLTSPAYASVYTPRHLEMLKEALPYQVLGVNSRDRVMLTYIFKRYLHECLSRLPSQLIPGELQSQDDFCREEYDHDAIAIDLMKDDGTFLRIATDRFLENFEALVTDPPKAVTPSPSERDDLADYCRERLTDDGVQLLIHALLNDRIFAAVYFATREGVYVETELRKDWDYNGPVSKYLRGKLKKGDTILPFFQSPNLTTVVNTLGNSGMEFKWEDLAKKLGNPRGILRSAGARRQNGKKVTWLDDRQEESIPLKQERVIPKNETDRGPVISELKPTRSIDEKRKAFSQTPKRKILIERMKRENRALLKRANSKLKEQIQTPRPSGDEKISD